MGSAEADGTETHGEVVDPDPGAGAQAGPVSPQRAEKKAAIPPSRWPLSRRATIFLILGTAFVLLGLIANVAGWKLVESRVRAKVEKVVGPAARWDIELNASWFDLFIGHIPSATITGHDVHTGTGLTLESIDIRLEGLGFAGRTITALVSATYRAKVNEHDLTDWFPKVQEHFDEIDAIAIRPAAIEVRGKIGQLSIFNAIERRLARNPRGRALVETVKTAARKALGGVKLIDLRIKGVLKVRDAVHVDFDVLELPVLGIPLPRIVCEALGAVANPVFDLADKPFGLRVNRIDPAMGYLMIEGSANPPVPFTP